MPNIFQKLLNLFEILQVAATSPNERFPQLQQAWERDPLTYSAYTRARNATEYLRACQETLEQLAEVCTLGRLPRGFHCCIRLS